MFLHIVLISYLLNAALIFFSTGEKGTGKSTQKPLHYKSCLFHRVVKDFMVQGGDFSEGETESTKENSIFIFLLNIIDGKDRQVLKSLIPVLFSLYVIFGQTLRIYLEVYERRKLKEGNYTFRRGSFEDLTPILCVLPHPSPIELLPSPVKTLLYEAHFILGMCFWIQNTLNWSLYMFDFC